MRKGRVHMRGWMRGERREAVWQAGGESKARLFHSNSSREFYTGCMTKAPVCGFALENAARRGGAQRVAGLDEVGRGPMFGPVVAAAVIFPERRRMTGLTDSKQLTEKQRNEFDVAIRECAVAWAIAAVDVETIDRINIRRASLLAMRLAVEQLAVAPDWARLSAD